MVSNVLLLYIANLFAKSAKVSHYTVCMERACSYIAIHTEYFATVDENNFLLEEGGGLAEFAPL